MDPPETGDRPTPVADEPSRTYPGPALAVFLVVVVVAAAISPGLAAFVTPFAVITALFTWRMGIPGFFAGLAVSALIFGICTAIVLNSFDSGW